MFIFRYIIVSNKNVFNIDEFKEVIVEVVKEFE